jgi:sec-independent protein translocase protein TatA
MFDNIGIGEIILIVVAVLIFFGPKKIPEIAQGIGKGIREFKKAIRDVEENITSEKPEEKKTIENKNKPV